MIFATPQTMILETFEIPDLKGKFLSQISLGQSTICYEWQLMKVPVDQTTNIHSVRKQQQGIMGWVHRNSAHEHGT